jgi:hypothetical protein
MRYERSRHERIREGEEKAKEGTDPETSATPRVSDDPKGDSSSRLNASKEPSEDEEKRRVSEKLREREQNS